MLTENSVDRIRQHFDGAAGAGPGRGQQDQSGVRLAACEADCSDRAPSLAVRLTCGLAGRRYAPPGSSRHGRNTNDTAFDSLAAEGAISAGQPLATGHTGDLAAA